MLFKGRVEIVSEIIANCGLDCSKCDAFIATQANDRERKKQIAKRWTEGLNLEFKPEDISCNGCVSNRISGWCTKICKVRPCARGRKVKTCAHCPDYPCKKLEEFLSNEPRAARNLEEIRKTLARYS